MCTMALTHSRVNRLYFIDSNSFDGGVSITQTDFQKNEEVCGKNSR